ncbi:MAG: hypothetical protein M0Z82_06330 [Actinomycetota bacterium]|nr:hypothetical protein [Actinomycetota bacterium]
MIGALGVLVGAPSASAASLSSPTQASYSAPAEYFSAVSCPSASTCLAVGYNTVSGPALYETTNAGATWVNDTVSLPSATGNLDSVSCTSATSCQAVGYSSSGPSSVALSYNGTRWTTETLPSGTGGLDSVSCTSATSCQAVGYSYTSSGSFGPAATGTGPRSWLGSSRRCGEDSPR